MRDFLWASESFIGENVSPSHGDFEQQRAKACGHRRASPWCILTTSPGSGDCFCVGTWGH